MITILIQIEDKIKEVLKNSGISNFRSIQEKSLKYIFSSENRENLLVVAPSASGKTLIGELGIIQATRRGQKGFYLVPLKAIANEKFSEFFKRYRTLDLRISVSTGDFDISLDEIEKSDICITTYERFDSIIRRKPEWIKQIGVVVIDEIHNVGNKSRGIRLESLITRLKTYRNLQLIGLSATIKNPQELSEWLNAKLIKDEKRPIELRYKVVVSDNKFETIKKLMKDLVNNNAQTLIFVRTRREAENLARKLSKNVKDLLKIEEIEELEGNTKSIIDSMLDFKIIGGGIGYHHAGLDSNSRVLVENLFRKKLLKAICCTTTLASGINTPAKVVIIKDLNVYQDSSGLVERIDRNRLHQIAGRAGRHLKDIGFAILMVSNSEEAREIKKHYFKTGKQDLKTRYDNIESLLPENQQPLIDETLVFIHHHQNGIERKNLISFFKKTFYFHQYSKIENNQYLIERFALDSEDIERLLKGHLVESDEIKDAKVKITTMMVNKIEGIVNILEEGVDFICNFSKNSKFCTCKRFKETNFCSHLYHLGKKVLDTNSMVAKDIIRNSFNKTFILDYLLKQDFIYLEDNKFKCSELGNLIVELFLDTRMFLFIKNRLKYIRGTFDFLDLIKTLTEMKLNKTLSYHFFAILNEVLNTKNISDVPNTLKKMVTNEIGLGDIENFFDLSRWITNAIIRVAENTIEGNNHIVGIGKRIFNKINLSLNKMGPQNDFIQEAYAPNMTSKTFDVDEIKKKFVSNLKYLLIIHKISGISLYSYNFSANELDSALISGYLSALSSFGIELSGGENVDVRKMEYESFKILIKGGEKINAGIIVNEMPDDWVSEKLEAFVGVIEKKYKKIFHNWDGELNVFNGIGSIFNEIFGVDLINR
ncbi:MAG: DEAD/DEAH box helicase [Promethearchaeota archaeon]|nr:MAG: DEAD/DEAH box helicase [Candidatus Lokiarchaeota archaeon]